MENITGTLSDSQIKRLVDDNKLIVENFNNENIKQACYELRASNIYHDISNQNTRAEIGKDEYILIKPKQMIVIITKETLDLPNDILGRILSKGTLFSIGLLPINTYADPGFKGKLGIVFNNISNNYLRINPNDSIAKIEFTKLGESVSSGYCGQHNYQSEMWPIKDDMILEEEEIRKDTRILSANEEIRLSYGDSMGFLADLVYKYSRRLMFTTLVYVILSSILIFIISKTQFDISVYFAIVMGLISNIIFAIISTMGTNISRYRSK